MRNAVERAARKNGYHVLGDFFDPGIRDLLGLDNATCWTIEGIAAGDPNYYGGLVTTVKVSSVPDVMVALGDGVVVNERHPDRIAQYAAGLLSLRQFHEMILDRAVMKDDGPVIVDWPPRFGMFLVDDLRFDVQTRGCLQIGG